MDRLTRLALMTEALTTLKRSHCDGDFVIFDDLLTKDYIQFMVIPFLGTDDRLEPCHARLPLTTDLTVPKAQMEVTDRGLRTNGPPSGMPPLTPQQVAAFRGFGFVLGDEHPNYTVFIDLDHLKTIAEECEYLFTVLSSSPHFDLGVTIHVLAGE